MSDNDSDNTKKPNKSDQAERRKAVRRVLVGGGIITAGSQLPSKWTKPVVETVLMAAHAGTSPVGAPTAAPSSVSSAPSAPPTTSPSAAPSSFLG